MLKVSSISSHSSHHSSHQRLSRLVGSESGILEAMENDTAVTSEHSAMASVAPSTCDTSKTDPASNELEPPQKRVKTEHVNDPTSTQAVPLQDEVPPPSGIDPPDATAENSKPIQPESANTVKGTNASNAESSIVTNSSNSSSSSGSDSSLHEKHQGGSRGPTVPNPTAPTPSNPLNAAATAPASAAEETSPPQKATKIIHLSQKYLGELEYMLREFRKLERQLLGAKGAAQLEESAGSRERREKLHSFILHLEDTVRQIEVGCSLEAQGKSILGVLTGTGDAQEAKPAAETPASSRQKEEEEGVMKLEEHILANLLPVKVRLKKQLAAQQGASRNPPGMPAPRRGSLQPSSAALGKGTFAAAAEERRKQAEAARLAAQEQHEQSLRAVSDPTQFGKPLGGGGSSLTQKLHGATLGSSKRTQGHGVGTSKPETVVGDSSPQERKILYAGMVPQSTQHKSGVSAASGVHELVIQDPHLIQKQVEQQEALSVQANATIAPSAQRLVSESPNAPAVASSTAVAASQAIANKPITKALDKATKLFEDEKLTPEERKRLRKQRRKRKLKRIARRREKERQRQIALHQQSQATQGTTKASSGRKKGVSVKGQGKKKGPRAVEYLCALCSEAYSSTCDYNPWWALAQHECPKCRKTQIPRIDISSPSNAIEYHPALLAHADDGGASASATPATTTNTTAATPATPSYKVTANNKDLGHTDIKDSDSESDLSELSDGTLSDDSMDSDDFGGELHSMSPAERAEHESFGHEYKGPVLSDDHASRLLVLMLHASTCPCKHKLTKHREVCKSVKYMMLHVRDCPGTTSAFDVCPFPWCRKVKHLLYHLVSCTNSEECAICSPKNLSSSLQGLVGLNAFRLKKHRQKLIAALKAGVTQRCRPVSTGQARNVSRPSNKKAAEAVKAKGRVQHQQKPVYSKAATSSQTKAPTSLKGARPVAPAPRPAPSVPRTAQNLAKPPSPVKSSAPAVAQDSPQNTATPVDAVPTTTATPQTNPPVGGSTTAPQPAPQAAKIATGASSIAQSTAPTVAPVSADVNQSSNSSSSPGASLSEVVPSPTASAPSFILSAHDSSQTSTPTEGPGTASTPSAPTTEGKQTKEDEPNVAMATSNAEVEASTSVEVGAAGVNPASSNVVEISSAPVQAEEETKKDVNPTTKPPEGAGTTGDISESNSAMEVDAPVSTEEVNQDPAIQPEVSEGAKE